MQNLKSSSLGPFRVGISSPYIIIIIFKGNSTQLFSDNIIDIVIWHSSYNDIYNKILL